MKLNSDDQTKPEHRLEIEKATVKMMMKVISTYLALDRSVRSTDLNLIREVIEVWADASRVSVTFFRRDSVDLSIRG
jgi:hypothetical protein